MRKLIPLNALYTFVAVAETGTMTEAAEVLNVSHSAVSQAIKSLETQLNQPLFRRVGRRVELNSAGQKYYRKVAPSLEQIVDATEALMSQHNENRITLNMVTSLALHWWIPRVYRFQETAPDIDIRISNITGVFSMESEGVDAALIHGSKNEWQDYYYEKLRDDELIMVASPELLSRSNARDESDLSALIRYFPCIMVTNPRRADDWAIWCKAHELPLPVSRKNLSFTSSAQAMQAAIRRLGVFVTHRLFVKDDIDQGLLKELGKPVIHPQQGFFFACQPYQLKKESILILRNWIRQEFSK